MSNAVTKMEPEERPTAVVVQADSASLMEVISRAASDPNTDVDKLERLMAMYERITVNKAKAAYSSALALMQPELPAIGKRGQIKVGHEVRSRYSLWEDVNTAIKPVLARHGFALSFRTGQQDAKIIVTGILSHSEGHSEETTMHLPVDTSGSKNAVQAIGSSTSYGKRYIAAALLNLTSTDEDDDGHKGGGGFITEEQADDLQMLIAEIGGDNANPLLKGFLRLMKVERLTDIPAAKFKEAKTALEDKRGKI